MTRRVWVVCVSFVIMSLLPIKEFTCSVPLRSVVAKNAITSLLKLIRLRMKENSDVLFLFIKPLYRGDQREEFSFFDVGLTHAE